MLVSKSAHTHETHSEEAKTQHTSCPSASLSSPRVHVRPSSSSSMHSHGSTAVVTLTPSRCLASSSSSAAPGLRGLQ